MVAKKNMAECETLTGASFALQPAGCVGTVPRDGGSRVDPEIHSTSSTAFRYPVYTMRDTYTLGTLLLLLAARSRSPALECETQQGLSERRRATQDLGVSGQKVKLIVVASTLSLPGPYPSGGPDGSRESLQLTATEHKAFPHLGSPFWTNGTEQGSFFLVT